MKTFFCRCGQPLSFDSSRCIRCGEQVGYDPVAAAFRVPDFLSHRHCANRMDHGVCNWLVAMEDANPLCVSCRITRVIPDLSRPGNLNRWVVLEGAKRRLLYGLLQLGLPLDGGGAHICPPLSFRFLEDRGANPMVAEEYVHTGHASGVITINVAEADDVQREMTRSLMNEAYRTPLGHFRHESGHYYFDRLIGRGSADAGSWLRGFLARFGDPEQDYDGALAAYYASPPPHAPEAGFISPYAQSHPLEDWAECWAHYLHILDTLETAMENGITLRSGEGSPDNGPDGGLIRDGTAEGQGKEAGFDGWIHRWQRLAVLLNELNRSMGLVDAYPFVLTRAIIEKLRFIHTLVHSAAPSPIQSGATR